MKEILKGLDSSEQIEKNRTMRIHHHTHEKKQKLRGELTVKPEEWDAPKGS